MLYQFYLSWRFYNNQGYTWVTNLGWMILSLSALFGWLPIYEFKKHGGVPRDKSYIHTSKLVTSGVYSVVRHPQFLAGILICVSMMLISQHTYSIVAGSIASIVYASEVSSADQKLVEKFGESYIEYMGKVPALNFIFGIISRVRGSSNKEHSEEPILVELEEAVNKLIIVDGFYGLIPEVGSNIVYARNNPVSSKDIAGIEGRIIKGKSKPMVCGEINYDASKHLASVILEAIRLNKKILSAINIRGGEDLPSLFDSINIEYYILPSKLVGTGCPVAYYLKKAESLYDAYIHPGDFGVEPTTTILAENPTKLVEIVSELVQT
jgi:predicted fused transcriptional regulator/phosphomethylpyrimidine kinase/protein-S-isoprenylcysteine O-methyltransferase Ste14